jgi:hypothetical protein
MARLQQGFPTGETGFRGQFARQQSSAAHVRFGSKADMLRRLRNVRFTPKSGHRNSVVQCSDAAKWALFDHLVGGVSRFPLRNLLSDPALADVAYRDVADLN